jgi:protein-disulfide isomerase
MPSKEATRRNKSVVSGRRGPSVTTIAGIVVVVLFAVAVGFAVYHVSTQQDGGAAIPPNATASGVPIGKADAPARVDLYVDFQCPVCQGYETRTGDTINSLIADGSARVIYHPVAILDPESDTKYSTRASAASGCAAADKVFPQFAKLLYANQPPEDGHGLPNSQLIAYGKQAGAGPNFAKCVNDQTYAKWSAALTDQASKNGLNGTPTVLVNGKLVDDISSPKALTDAVNAAAHK